MPEIKAATLDDAPVLAAIGAEVWTGTYQRDGVSPFFAEYVLSTFTSANMHALLNDENEQLFVCALQDGLVGYIRLSFNSKGEHPDCTGPEIATLYVQPRHHGKGIGAKLLNAAYSSALEHGRRSVWLTTNSENEPAIGFYKNQSFSHVGEMEYPIGDRTYTNHVFVRKLDEQQ